MIPALAWVQFDDADADAMQRLNTAGGDFAEIVAAGFVMTLNTPAAVKAKQAEMDSTRVPDRVVNLSF